VPREQGGRAIPVARRRPSGPTWFRDASRPTRHPDYDLSYLHGERIQPQMTDRSTLTLHSRLSPPRLLAVAVVVVTALAILSPAQVIAGTPNVCHITGITKAVAKKVFPKLSGISHGQTEAATTPPNFGVCDLVPKTSVAPLEVELWSSSVFAEQVTTFTNSGKLQHLRGLGAGAIYSSVKGDKNDGNIVFKRGAYTVLIDPTRIGGTAADYPSENQYVTLARAIYKHLR
jgi:hypothetical protein